MHSVDDDEEEIKPGNSLSTPEWWTATRAMTLEQRGFAIATLIFMHQTGWRDIPDDATLAKGIKLHIRRVRRLRPALEAVAAHTVAEQLKMIARWPQWIIDEVRA